MKITIEVTEMPSGPVRIEATCNAEGREATAGERLAGYLFREAVVSIAEQMAKIAKGKMIILADGRPLAN